MRSMIPHFDPLSVLTPSFWVSGDGSCWFPTQHWMGRLHLLRPAWILEDLRGSRWSEWTQNDNLKVVCFLIATYKCGLQTMPDYDVSCSVEVWPFPWKGPPPTVNLNGEYWTVSKTRWFRGSVTYHRLMDVNRRSGVVVCQDWEVVKQFAVNYLIVHIRPNEIRPSWSFGPILEFGRLVNKHERIISNLPRHA